MGADRPVVGPEARYGGIEVPWRYVYVRRASERGLGRIPGRGKTPRHRGEPAPSSEPVQTKRKARAPLRSGAALSWWLGESGRRDCSRLSNRDRGFLTCRRMGGTTECACCHIQASLLLLPVCYGFQNMSPFELYDFNHSLWLMFLQAMMKILSAGQFMGTSLLNAPFDAVYT